MDKSQDILEKILSRLDSIEAQAEKNKDEIIQEMNVIRDQVIENSEGIADLKLNLNEFKDEVYKRFDTVDNQLDDLREGEMALSDRLHNYDKQIRKLKRKA